MKREHLKEFFRRQYSLLTEQEEDDPFATDEGGDEEGDEGGDEEGGEDEAADDADADAGEEEEKPDVDEEDEQRYKKSMDDQLQAILVDIEADSIKSAQVQQESNSLLQVFINESSDVPLDTDKFASEVARVILNFDAFVDLEGMLLAKVRSFLIDKHGEEVADEIEGLLKSRHDIERMQDEKKHEEEVENQVPIAVGATSGAGA